MSNEVKLTFAGDATKLAKANAAVVAGADDVGKTALKASKGLEDQSKRLDRVTVAAFSAADGLDGINAAMDSVHDAMTYGARATEDLADAENTVKRAAHDVEQAMQDMRQATRDATAGKLDAADAALSEKEALQDIADAQNDYSEAVHEYGRSSREAKTALLAIERAQLDVKRAQEDGRQAQEDIRQANLDGKSAALDQAEAQSDLAKSQRELAEQSSTFKKVSDYASMATGILTGLAAVIGIVTASQWAWNAALAASGIGLIIIAIAGLVAGIVYLATQTEFFQKLWHAVWSGIVAYIRWVASNYQAAFHAIAAAGAWLWDKLKAIGSGIKSVFSSIGSGIKAAFREAFNSVARGWNASIGRLHWSVPGWVPGLGGATVSVPRLPTYHTGGVVPGLPGSNQLAIVQAGEEITSIGGTGRSAGTANTIMISSDGSQFADLIVETIQAAINRGALRLRLS